MLNARQYEKNIQN